MNKKMNVIRYIVAYFLPSKRILSVFIATPIAQSISPYLVTYGMGIHPVLAPPFIYASTYLIARPLSYVTFYIIDYFPMETSNIELTSIKNEIKR